ncbi:MAG: hypothetical protein OXE59_06090 [Bacteroidetes bacterium]|nr:hypothetical protein [Bacteroidota bacterium]MCY4233294.1 hypothetical protein [Bacteroidota bacterium]
MLIVTIQLGINILTDWAPVTILIFAAIATLRYKINSVWLVAGGADLGLLLI